MTDKNTDRLFNELKNEKNIEAYLNKNADELVDINLATYLEKMLQLKNIKKAEVAKASGLDVSYVYHIFQGRKQPNRNKVLALAFGFKATLEETQYMLRYAKQNLLYPRDKWDSIIISAINQHLSVTETDVLLSKLGETTFINKC